MFLWFASFAICSWGQVGHGMLSILSFKFVPSVMQFSLGLDGKKLEPESNVLLASIENMQYAVTLDVLYTVTLFLSCKKAFVISFITIF